MCRDPVGFLVTEYLGVDPVELQHQSVNQLGVQPLIRAQELDITLQLVLVAIKIWSRKIGKKVHSALHKHFNS